MAMNATLGGLPAATSRWYMGLRNDGSTRPSPEIQQRPSPGDVHIAQHIGYHDPLRCQQPQSCLKSAPSLLATDGDTACIHDPERDFGVDLKHSVIRLVCVDFANFREDRERLLAQALADDPARDRNGLLVARSLDDGTRRRVEHR